MGEGRYGTDKEERLDTESKEDKNGKEEAATRNRLQARNDILKVLYLYILSLCIIGIKGREQ